MSNEVHALPITRLLTEREVCSMLHVSRVALLTWRRRGLFPSPLKVGLGRAIRWRPEDVERWITTRPRGSGAPPEAA